MGVIFHDRTTSFPSVLVIAGTTAVGKTDLSLELARRLNGEVISVDSVQVDKELHLRFRNSSAESLVCASPSTQVYRHMDIGSAKVEGELCSTIPHHLLDVVSPSEPFSALSYYDLASQALQVGGASLVTMQVLSLDMQWTFHLFEFIPHQELLD